MLAYERQNKILEVLKEKNVCTVEQFIQMFPKFSESTIRRDLRYLESHGKIITFHGGDVMLKHKDYEDPYAKKRLMNAKGKMTLAKYASTLIKNGDTIYIDASTTCLEILQYINKDVTIVTNSVKFDLFDKFEFNVYLIGGNVTRASSYACYDMLAKEMLKAFNFDIAFVGCGGINEHDGICYPRVEQAIYERALKKQSKRYIVLADYLKFENSFTGRAFDINECEVYTDAKPADLKKYKNIKQLLSNDEEF